MNLKLTSELIKISTATYSISARLTIPEKYTNVLVIANGSGGNMDSPFIKHISQRIAIYGIMIANFNFHYQEIGRKFPDKNEKCQETYLAVYEHLKNVRGEKDVAIGGKSMGGRIATQIAAKVNCKKIAVLGYPLHPPGKPDKLRDQHLYPLEQNVLIVQGEKDSFGTQNEIQPVIEKMKNAQAFYVPSANHSLKAPKKSGLNNATLEQKIIENIVHFIRD